MMADESRRRLSATSFAGEVLFEPLRAVIENRQVGVDQR
jgi:hypothetical protein